MATVICSIWKEGSSSMRRCSVGVVLPSILPGCLLWHQHIFSSRSSQWGDSSIAGYVRNARHRYALIEPELRKGKVFSVWMIVEQDCRKRPTQSWKWLLAIFYPFRVCGGAVITWHGPPHWSPGVWETGLAMFCTQIAYGDGNTEHSGDVVDELHWTQSEGGGAPFNCLPHREVCVGVVADLHAVLHRTDAGLWCTWWQPVYTAVCLGVFICG